MIDPKTGKSLSNFRQLLAWSRYWPVPLDAPAPLPQVIELPKPDDQQDGGKDADSYKLNPVTPRA